MLNTEKGIEHPLTLLYVLIAINFVTTRAKRALEVEENHCQNADDEADPLRQGEFFFSYQQGIREDEYNFTSR